MIRCLTAFSLFLLFISCADPERERSENGVDTDLEIISASELYRQCDDTLFAALYHLPMTRPLYNADSSDLTGQPISAFYDLLSVDKKESLLIELQRFLNSPSDKSFAAQLSKQLSRWCETADVIQESEDKMSREELLAKLYETDRFSYLFLEFQDQQVFRNEELAHIDKVASLSSAQSNNIISTLITDVSMSLDTSYDTDLEHLENLQL